MKTEIKKDIINGKEVTEITLNNGNILTITENEKISKVRLVESVRGFKQPNGKVRAVTLKSNNKDGMNVNVHTTMKKTDSKIRKVHNGRGGEIIVEKKNCMEEAETMFTDGFFSNVINIFFNK